MLHYRPSKYYGKKTLEEINQELANFFKHYKINCDFFQSNSEGEIVNIIQKAIGNYDAIIINPAAYTHTSIAIRDAIEMLDIPVIEVHLSKPDTRESFRKTSLITDVVTGKIEGFGPLSYLIAAFAVIKLLNAS